jgi:flagellar motility protein MotE (MotC chaperone)
MGEKMKNAYDQFFKKAQDIKRKESPPKPVSRFQMKAKPRPAAEDKHEARLRQTLRMKAKKRAPFPWKALAGLAISVSAVAAYLTAPDAFHTLISKIEVSAIGSAGAAEEKAAEKSKAGAEKAEKAAAKDEKANPDHGPEAKSEATEDLSHYEKLKQRKEELDAREKELTELEEELQRQKVELDKRIQQLEDMRGQIATVLKDRVEVDQEKVTKLVDLYSNMKPKQAAEVLGSINEDLAVEVLAKMKKKNAAEIMNLLSPEKAKVLSEKYTGYRRAHGEPKG